MLRALPGHLVAMAVFVGVLIFGVRAIGAALPTLNRDLVVGLGAVYVAAWLGLIVITLIEAGLGRDARARWQRRNRWITWGGSADSILAYWLVAPYAALDLQLVFLLFHIGIVTINVVASIDRPRGRGAGRFLPLALPASIAAFYATHWNPYAPALIVFAVSYGFVAQALRETLQTAVDRANAARRTAEAALVEVAAERDAKTRFLASASHDLGQPLQAARLFFDQAMKGRTAAQRTQAARKVTWAFDATEQLLRQMLDHLRLESGTVQPSIGKVAVGPLIARIAEMNEPAARLAGISIRAMPSQLSALADASLAERALGNLVANAIRHAKARRVLVGARRQAGRVRLWVVDDGVGIAEADAPRLFDDFVQGSNHGDEIRGGFGLGLGSARRMAGLMAGSVGLERKWTHGSAFWLELAAAEAVAR
jgi:signal transduction histidine kinase